jgi:hypothetical protein
MATGTLYKIPKNVPSNIKLIIRRHAMMASLASTAHFGNEQHALQHGSSDIINKVSNWIFSKGTHTCHFQRNRRSRIRARKMVEMKSPKRSYTPHSDNHKKKLY